MYIRLNIGSRVLVIKLGDCSVPLSNTLIAICVPQCIVSDTISKRELLFILTLLFEIKYLPNIASAFL